MLFSVKFALNWINIKKLDRGVTLDTPSSDQIDV